MGDGGSGGDPNERAQDDGQLLGKMLRIDVGAAPPVDPLDDVFEGDACFDPAPHFAMCSAAVGLVTPPVLTYTHAEGCSITGRFVYRDCAMPDVRGTYFYSDFCSAWIRSIRVVGGSATAPTDHTADLESTGVSIDLVASFGEDARGELYICGRGGQAFRIAPGA